MPCVLVVDDDSAARRIILLLLRSDGYETESANYGAEALALMRQRRPCLVLLAKLPAIHQRHVDVQEHEAGAPLPHQGEGFRAIFRGFSFVAV